MHAALICPSARPGVAALAGHAPLAALPLLGETVLEYWLAHLAGRGVRRVTLLAPDRPDEIERVAGDGARWGLSLEVVATSVEPGVEEVRAAHAGKPPDEIVLLDHLPGLPGARMFDDYGRWFVTAHAWMEHALMPDRVGWRQIRPGVYAGWHTRIPDDAILHPPCWIGEKVFLGPAVTLGPMTVVENCAVIETGVEVVDSIVGPETVVGRCTEVRGSLAWDDTLIDWRTGACLRVTDDFLLCPLRGQTGVAHRSGPAARPAPNRGSRLLQVPFLEALSRR